MDYFIKLDDFCIEISLSIESAMFLAREGSISVTKSKNNIFIDKENAEILKLASEIKNELEVNDEGISVILQLREKVIDYQKKLAALAEAANKSKSIDELVFILRNNPAFRDMLED